MRQQTADDFRERASVLDRTGLDWLAALAAENIAEGKEKPVTPFDTTAGQWNPGRQEWPWAQSPSG
jgi:hypothetical protein